jgi:Mg2+/Co2+ transporter CorC
LAKEHLEVFSSELEFQVIAMRLFQFDVTHADNERTFVLLKDDALRSKAAIHFYDVIVVCDLQGALVLLLKHTKHATNKDHCVVDLSRDDTLRVLLAKDLLQHEDMQENHEPVGRNSTT